MMSSELNINMLKVPVYSILHTMREEQSLFGCAQNVSVIDRYQVNHETHMLEINIMTINNLIYISWHN